MSVLNGDLTRRMEKNQPSNNAQHPARFMKIIVNISIYTQLHNHFSILILNNKI